ncbi:MAG: hypothetical protein JXA10_10205 [Anaerolineae bacterium]|nr:hypothetical protein [Anaerolineae bacterium]
MNEPAYVALDKDGHVAVFWGDGTEAHKEVILRGPRPANSQELVAMIEDLRLWAEDEGYTVVVPAYDLEVPDIEIDLPEEDAAIITPDDVDDLLDDLFMAGGEDDFED